MVMAISFSFLLGSLDGVNYTIKFLFFLPDYPIVHTKHLATNNSKAHVEGPMIVLRIVRNTIRLPNPWIRSRVHKATQQAIAYGTWPTHVKTQQSSPSSELVIVPHTLPFPPVVACPHAHHHPVTHSTFSPSPPRLLLPPISHCSSYMQFIVMFPLLYTLPKSQLTILPDFLIVTSSYSISLRCYLFYYLTTMYTMPIQQSDYQPRFPPS